MEIFETKEAIQSYLEEQRSFQKTSAFVPTMGALHEGHLSLIQAAKKIADLTICSIFVNPTQFNDPKDLEKYPRTTEQDILLLRQHGCDILFLPTVEEMYPEEEEKWHIDLGELDKIWEGANRPGHFQGVTQIVYKLFQIVKPNYALFGQKDYQQVRVIQSLVNSKQLPIQIVSQETIRSEKGLALSSRNSLLSEQGKEKALVLYRALSWVKTNFNTNSIKNLQKEATAIIQKEEVELEYFAICEADSLQEATEKQANKSYVALVVVRIENIRLIDNMILQ